MKKPYKHIEINKKRRCSKCNKPLKKNLLEKNPDADLCYCCWNLSRGRKLRVINITRSQPLRGTFTLEKVIDYKRIQEKNRNYYGYKK